MASNSRLSFQTSTNTGSIPSMIADLTVGDGQLAMPAYLIVRHRGAHVLYAWLTDEPLIQPLLTARSTIPPARV